MKSESKIIMILVVGLLGTLVVGMNVRSEVQTAKNVSKISEVATTKESNQVKDEEEKKKEEKNTTQEKTTKEDREEKEENEKVVEVAVVEPTPVPTPTPEPIVYDGLTMNQLAEKLNRSLGSTLSGTGYTFASESLALGIDPYLAVAIVLHETGCQWECSYLVQACNNVGGMKGSPGCNGGSYASFSTLDDGIRSYLSNLYRNYYAYGLTTPETIGPKYAASPTWASKVNWYINSIRSK